MRNYKKRTLALILASAITVAGSFAAENYKNSLMDLKFKSAGSNVIAVFHTQTKYDKPINLVKTAPDTYVATFPEVNSKIATPSITGNIKSVDIKTMPQTTNSKGYTKVTIKTNANVSMQAKSAIFIPSKATQSITTGKQFQTPVNEEILPPEPKTDILDAKKNNTSVTSQSDYYFQRPKTYSEPQKPSYKTENSENKPSTVQQKPTQKPIKQPVQKQKEEFNIAQAFPLIFGGLVVFVLILLIYLRSKDKMAEVTGGAGNYDFSDDSDKKNKPPVKTKTRNTIQKAQPHINLKNEKVNMITGNIVEADNTKIQEEKEDDVPLTVDLDELYQKKINAEEVTVAEDETPAEETDDLAEFLSEFSFEEEIEEQVAKEIQEQYTYNEELYNKILNSSSIYFSKEDSYKIGQLLKSEITEETLDEIKKWATAPIQPQKPTKQKILENLIISYSLERNITFTQQDVDILRKLISVEIDPSFVNDLRVDSKRAELVAKEITAKGEELKKPSEVKILHVGSLLPNMEEEIKKHGNAKIMSEAKPSVVYFSKDFDVDVLKTQEELPDLHTFIDLDNEYKPSYKEEIVADGYEFKTLYIKDELPDLDKPYSYKETAKIPEHTQEEDEQILLSNISNVTFKPFYDGEINVEEPKKPDKSVQLRKEKPSVINQILSARANDDAKKLLEIIEQQQNTRDKKAMEQTSFKKELENVKHKHEETDDSNVLFGKCIMNNEEYKIISHCALGEKNGLYLGQNDDGYMLIGYIDNNFFEIKKYDELKSTGIQARVREKLGDNTIQYLVRIGHSKIVVNKHNDSMEFVMDLC